MLIRISFLFSQCSFSISPVLFPLDSPRQKIHVVQKHHKQQLLDTICTHYWKIWTYISFFSLFADFLVQVVICFLNTHPVHMYTVRTCVPAHPRVCVCVFGWVCMYGCVNVCAFACLCIVCIVSEWWKHAVHDENRIIFKPLKLFKSLWI